MQTASNDPLHEPRAPTVEPRRGISLVWILPLVAAVLGIGLFARTLDREGPKITVAFNRAAGLEAGKTPVKYKDVVVGSVESVELSTDKSQVLVTVELDRSAASLANADSRFWVVLPRIGTGGVSGVDTLLSGAYIGMDTGTSSTERRAFIGLEEPPAVINGTPGRTFALRAEDLGSLDIGSPIYFRRIQVGRVASYRMDTEGEGVALQVFVDAPYDRFVTPDTRFWNSSGVDVSLGADGLKLKTQSLATIVAGGIAFSKTDGAGSKTEAPDGTRFALDADEKTSSARADGPTQKLEFQFDQSLRGLHVGAPVEFLGVPFGSVTAVTLDYDAARRKFAAVVDADIYPSRIGRIARHLPPRGDRGAQRAGPFVQRLVADGLRAQAPSALLTGQRYISIDFVADAPKVAFDPNRYPLEIPTVDGKFDQLQEKLGRIVDKVERMPLDSIGQRLDTDLAQLDTTLATANRTFGTFNDQLLPEASSTLAQAQRMLGGADAAFSEDSPLQQNLGATLIEVQRSARSLRELLDLLGSNPEALLRGRPADSLAIPVSPSPKPVSEAKP